jgi:type IV pilus assembly protein PilC
MSSHHAPAGTLARAHFYGQLATLLSAGLPVVQTLEQLARNPPHPSLREPVGTLLGCLKSGRTFTESFQLLGRWAPAFDIALIHAGELSGRLDQTFKTLARHHQERAANNRLLLRESFYPAIVLHAAIFIIPIPSLIRSGSIVQYFFQTFGVLILIYAIVGLVLWALRGDRPQPWRAFIEGMVMKIPLLGSARADLALSRLAASLEALTTAGILITEAWPLAAAASGFPLV